MSRWHTLMLCAWLMLVGITECCIADGVDFTDVTKAVVVKSSDPEFTITLKSNPTTGYLWILKSYDKSLILPVSNAFYPSTNKELLGAPGYEKWVFRARPDGFIKPRSTTITMVYARPWEMEHKNFQPTNIKIKLVTNNDDKTA